MTLDMSIPPAMLDTSAEEMEFFCGVCDDEIAPAFNLKYASGSRMDPKRRDSTDIIWFPQPFLDAMANLQNGRDIGKNSNVSHWRMGCYDEAKADRAYNAYRDTQANSF